MMPEGCSCDEIVAAPNVGAAKGGVGTGRLMTTRGTDTGTCYNCWKPWHIALDCYSKPQNTAAVDEEDAPHHVFGLEEGWRPVRQGLKGRTVGGIEARPVNTENRFQELGEEESTPSTLSIFALLDEETEDLCTTDDYECVMVEGILDSGSVTHVIDKVEAPGYKVEETAASRWRQMFTGAGEKNVNEGEMNPHLLAENGHTERASTYGAESSRPRSQGRFSQWARLATTASMCSSGRAML